MWAIKKKSRRHLSRNLLANGRPSSKLLCVLGKGLNIPSSSGLSLTPQHAQVGPTAEEGTLKKKKKKQKPITSALLLFSLPLHRCAPLVRTWPSAAPLPPGKEPLKSRLSPAGLSVLAPGQMFCYNLPVPEETSGLFTAHSPIVG